MIHVHATDFDRSRGNVNPTVYSIEKNGMDHADCIMCVSELTRQTVINHYHQDPAKCFAMHNAVYPLAQELQEIVDQRKPYSERKEKVVTFLGRITMQKGPEYFIEAAKRVLDRTHNVRFCFAGSGDMMNSMIEMAAAYGIADRCHFPGFMKGKQVFECFRDSDVYDAFRVGAVWNIPARGDAKRSAFHYQQTIRLRRDSVQVHQGGLLGYRCHGRCHVCALHVSLFA